MIPRDFPRWRLKRIFTKPKNSYSMNKRYPEFLMFELVLSRSGEKPLIKRIILAKDSKANLIWKVTTGNSLKRSRIKVWQINNAVEKWSTLLPKLARKILTRLMVKKLTKAALQGHYMSRILINAYDGKIKKEEQIHV